MLTNKFKINYSIGSVANGIKTDSFTFFLLFFYSNIIGLNPGLAGNVTRLHPLGMLSSFFFNENISSIFHQ